MAARKIGVRQPRVHHVGPGEQVVFHGPDGKEMPAVAVIAATPQGMPVVLAASDQLDKEALMIACLQVLHEARRQAERSPLAKAGFVVPPGALTRQSGGDDEPVQ